MLWIERRNARNIAPGWSLKYRSRSTYRDRGLASLTYTAYDDTPNVTGKPWVPFVLDYWAVEVCLLGRRVANWRRYANRYGRVT